MGRPVVLCADGPRRGARVAGVLRGKHGGEVTVQFAGWVRGSTRGRIRGDIGGGVLGAIREIVVDPTERAKQEGESIHCFGELRAAGLRMLVKCSPEVVDSGLIDGVGSRFQAPRHKDESPRSIPVDRASGETILLASGLDGRREPIEVFVGRQGTGGREKRGGLGSRHESGTEGDNQNGTKSAVANLDKKHSDVHLPPSPVHGLGTRDVHTEGGRMGYRPIKDNCALFGRSR